MKKTISFLLAAILLFSLFTALAAGDAVVSKDTKLTSKFNIYNNYTVKAGVTVDTGNSSGEPNGIEIYGTLTLEEGAKLIGGGIIIMHKGSKAVNANLYYRIQEELIAFPEISTAYELYTAGDDYSFSFSYDSAAGCWLWDVQLEGDPFGLYQPEPPEPEVQEPQGPGDPDAPAQQPDPLAEYKRQAKTYADTLKELGLMKGTGTAPNGSTEYELDRAATRIEALVMLIRLLGKENEALTAGCSHPFTDVPGWADAYVGYAYEMKLTNGVSADKFGTGAASGAMYITFLLRAMGYNDDPRKGETDFVWSDPLDFARSNGLNLPDDRMQAFIRADMAVASFRALSSRCKNGHSLSAKLVGDGVFTESAYETVMHPYSENAEC